VSAPHTARDHAARMARARLSLEGLSLGDAFGERFFVPDRALRYLLDGRTLPGPPWLCTDDTVMALSIVEVLELRGEIDPDLLARAFAAKYLADPERGYGVGAHRILRRISEGEDWRRVAVEAFGGAGSLGNGGAMRAAPIGAYYEGDAARAAEQARRSAEVTHAHPEGQAGAMAVAAAAACAAQVRDGKDLLDAALEHTPDGETRRGLLAARQLPFERPVEIAVHALGNGSRVTSPDTVPFALWSAARRPGSFVEAMWQTVAGLGDRDTTCAIVGGIVILAPGGAVIPAEWLASRESLERLAWIGIRARHA
jgi:ADP-ribosylglycohydrolase